MIIPLNIETENTYYKIFETIKCAFNKLNTSKKRKEDLINIYKITRDPLFKYIIEIDKAPDYSTLFLRLNKIENFIYYGIYTMLIEFINPDIRICAIDGTALRSSKFDGDAKKGKGTRLGFYTGYKLHCFGNRYNNSTNF